MTNAIQPPALVRALSVGLLLVPMGFGVSACGPKATDATHATAPSSSTARPSSVPMTGATALAGKVVRAFFTALRTDDATGACALLVPSAALPDGFGLTCGTAAATLTMSSRERRRGFIVLTLESNQGNRLATFDASLKADAVGRVDHWIFSVEKTTSGWLIRDIRG